MTRLSNDILDDTCLITEDDNYPDMQCPNCSTQILINNAKVRSQY
jgi:DNA-directed RNA polymerase subunit RPC12/RpoP